MKIARFEFDGRIRTGVVEGNELRETHGDAFGALAPTGATYPLDGVRLLTPVDPPNVICIGRNYAEHAREGGVKPPERPLIFLKATSSIVNPGDAIVIPDEAPDFVDYEGELVIVVKKKAKNVDRAEALDYVLGYTVGNDVSARDCQLKIDQQWARGKSFDTFCPFGPWIETDLDPGALSIKTVVSGETMQDGTTADMIFDCAHLVSYISHSMSLLPGTIIMTGTPSGVGHARNPMRMLRPGDLVAITVSGIGTLSNPVR